MGKAGKDPENIVYLRTLSKQAQRRIKSAETAILKILNPEGSYSIPHALSYGEPVGVSPVSNPAYFSVLQRSRSTPLSLVSNHTPTYCELTLLNKAARRSVETHFLVYILRHFIQYTYNKVLSSFSGLFSLRRPINA